MLAGATKSIRVGLNVAVTPWLHPFVWAKYVASLDAATGGRIIAGFGLGAAPPRSTGASSVLHDNFGIDGSKRGVMSDEGLDIITKLWTQDEPLSFSGTYYRGTDLIVEPKPIQKPYPELWWAGQNIRLSVPRASRYGRFLEIVAWTVPGNAAEAIKSQYMPALAAENAKWNGTAELCVMIYANVHPKDLDSHELSERYWRWPPSILESVAAGSPERCAKVITSLLAAGASHIVLDMQRHGYDHVGELHAQMELFVDKVLPLVEAQDSHAAVRPVQHQRFAKAQPTEHSQPAAEDRPPE
jgi:alkanesulfonate monooxygenase SsuD/methylene tetrahydromethanopterin reductase-like flavin-dependent oxidoreductase (luciferase family)